MTMSIRVLVVATWYPSHDAPRRGVFVADHVDALRKAGADVVVVSPETIPVRGPLATRSDRARQAAHLWAPRLGDPDGYSIARSWGAPGVPVARPPVVLDAGEPGAATTIDAYAATLLATLEPLFRRWHIDIVHAHTGFPDGIAVARVADRLARPLVVSEHDSAIVSRLSDPVVASQYAPLLRGSHRLVAVSQAQRQRVAAALGVSAAPIGVLPNAVDIDSFRAAPLAERDPLELLYVGNRKASKGFDRMLRAFALVHRARPTLRLRCIGQSATAAEEAGWKELAADLGIRDGVSFEPSGNRLTVAAAMSRAWIFVHPSDFETFGVVAAEALASGLPVAATPSGGVDELLGDAGAYGEVAAGTEPAELAVAVERLLARRPELEPDRLRTRARHLWAPEVVARQSLELYESLGVLDGRGDAQPATTGIWSPRDPPQSRLPLVVGLSQIPAQRRVASLPEALAARLTVVTLVREPVGAEHLPLNPDAAGRWLECDPERAYREAWASLGGPGPREATLRWWLAAIRTPMALLRRRRLNRRRRSIRQAALASCLSSAWVPLETAGAKAARQVLPVEGDDVLAAQTLLAAGAVLSPGSLRWLADRWDSVGPEASIRPRR